MEAHDTKGVTDVSSTHKTFISFHSAFTFAVHVQRLGKGRYNYIPRKLYSPQLNIEMHVFWLKLLLKSNLLRLDSVVVQSVRPAIKAMRYPPMYMGINRDYSFYHLFSRALFCIMFYHHPYIATMCMFTCQLSAYTFYIILDNSHSSGAKIFIPIPRSRRVVMDPSLVLHSWVVK
jgi:hypothetical protein